MTPLYRRAPGVLVEPIGRVWAAFSPLSGETILLNDESAAILEIVDGGPASTADMAAVLAQDSGLPESELTPIVAEAWVRLVEGGLVIMEMVDGASGS